MLNVLLCCCFAKIRALGEKKADYFFLFFYSMFWIHHTELHLQTMVFGRFAVLFTTELVPQQKLLSKKATSGFRLGCASYLSCISSASSSTSILNKLKWAASLAFSHNHSKPFPTKHAKTASDECLPHVAISKELDGSTSCCEGELCAGKGGKD